MKILSIPFLLAAALGAQTMPFEMAKPGLDVCVVVSDMAKATHFYGDVLGLKPATPIAVPLPAGSEMAWYQAGSTSIKLRVFAKTPPKVEQGTMAANGIRLMTMFVKDPDALLKRIADSGLPAPQFISPETAPYRYGFVSDPDGNQIELLAFKRDMPAETFDRFQIGLTVSDGAKTREFYTKVLGLTERPGQPLAGSPGATEYFAVAGSTTIKFWSPAGDRPTRAGAIGDALGIRYFTFMVKDVDATYEALKARGVKITTPPRNLTDPKLGDTARIMLTADPDGNTIEFATLLKP